VFADFTGAISLNDRGQLVFAATVSGPTITPGMASVLYAWDDPQGPVLLCQRLSPITFGGASHLIDTFGSVQHNNGAGAPLGLNQAGDLVLKITTTDGKSAIVRTQLPDSTFFGQPGAISVQTGGTFSMALNGGFAHAGATYMVLGTVSGTAPGVSVGSFLVPLNLDLYTEYTLSYPNVPPLVTTLGALDANAHAAASLQVPAGLLSAAGSVLHHAFVVLDPGGGLAFVSEPIRLDLVN
jgi:hypothetical protein